MQQLKKHKWLILIITLLAVALVFIVFTILYAPHQVNISLDNKNVQAFLSVIRHAEGTSGPNGYRTLFGGKLFSDFSKHPNIKVPFRNTYSTAASAYQILNRTWIIYKAKLGLTDFSPASQDKVAIELIRGEKALDDVIAGRFDTAIDKCQNIWASLPDVKGGEKNAGYNQNPKSLAELQKIYTKNGGQFA